MGIYIVKIVIIYIKTHKGNGMNDILKRNP